MSSENIVTEDPIGSKSMVIHARIEGREPILLPYRQPVLAAPVVIAVEPRRTTSPWSSTLHSDCKSSLPRFARVVNDPGQRRNSDGHWYTQALQSYS